MNEGLMARCELFVENRDAMKAAFPWESSYFYPVCAALFTDKGIRTNAEHLKSCHKLFKEKIGIFSNFRGAAEVSLVAMIALDKEPAARLDRAMQIHGMLKEHFWGSTYLPVAAMILSDAVEPQEYGEICARTRRIYDLMKKAHPFLTSDEDSVFAAMLALSGLSDEEVVRETETCYDLLKERFFSSNPVQSLSHVLALTEDPMRTAKDKCRDTVLLFDILKEKGYKYGTEYELATLGTLAMLPCGIEITAQDLIEVDGFLAQQKGYGIFGLTKKQRLMHAGMLVVSEHIGGSDTMHTAAVGSTLSLIAAQQAATCAAIAATAAAANSAN
ncbi:MAG: DUF4003 domain-containing protein [Clostridia bacterium]|nr:DUF4003 domain-containing protein [Clostridia bacterium]